MMFEPGQIKLGIAPIGWTNDDLPELGGDISFNQCITEMHAAGFVGTEIGSKFPNEPKKVVEALKPLGLEIAGQWFSSFFSTSPVVDVLEAFEKHVRFLADVGAPVAIVSEQGNSIQGQEETPLLANKPVITDDTVWNRLVDGLQQAGEVAKTHGLNLAYHHHMGTVVQSEDEINRLMRDTDPASVNLVLDTGHATFSGINPLDLIANHGSRIIHIHLKDIRADVLDRVKAENLSFLQAVKEGVFTVPGDGCIDFPRILEKIAALDYHGWMVVEAEQDPAKANPLEYAKKARKYIKEVAGI